MPQLSAKTKLLKRNILKLKSVDKNKKLLETLYLHYTIDLQDIIDTLNLKSDMVDFPEAKLEDIQFINKNLLNHIKSKMHVKKAIAASYKSNTLKLFMTFYEEKEIPKNDFFRRLLAKCFTLMEKGALKNKVITFHIWMSNALKKFTNNNGILTEENINSGASVYNILNETKTIYLYRKEEIEKVCLHELIHALDYDFKVYPEHFTREIKNTLNLPQDITLKIGEAYTEFWANILNTIFVTYFTLKDKSNFKKTLIKNFKAELGFSLLQCAKILQYYGYSCVTNCNNAFALKQNSDNFKQTTSVFSYFIIKTGMLYNLKHFLKLQLKYSSKNLLQFQEKHINEYHMLIMNFLKHNSSYFKQLDNTLKLIKKTKLPNIQKNTLRMTLLELKII